jgi:tetratricopeptide (TPR) repeat protein
MRAFANLPAAWPNTCLAVLCALCFSVSYAAGQSRDELPLVSPLNSAVADLPLDPQARVQIEQAVGSRDYPGAETYLLQALDKNPKDVRLLTYTGRIFFLDHQYLNAAIALKKADHQHPLADPDRFTLAMSYVSIKKPDWARGELDRLAQADPANPLYIYWLGRLDYDRQKMKDAAEKFRHAVSLDSTFMRAYDYLGLCLEAMGKSEEAIQEFGHALSLDRDRHVNSPWPPLNMGILYVRLNRLEEAEPFFREALRFDPSFAPGHYQLGALLEKQGKTSQAIEELKRAGELDPADPQPHYALARIYRHAHDTREADLETETFRTLRAKSSEE